MSKRPLADEEANSPKKKRAAKDPKPLDPKKFGGKTEEEVCQMLLPDHLAPGLDIIFMGINPGLYSAYLGHHYCSANNHFWPCLYESGLIPRKVSFMDDSEVLNYGIGMSNIVPRTTRSASELSRKEIKDWSIVMTERMQELNPLIICFNGKGIYEIFTGGKCTVGLQEEPLPGTDIVMYVMPSTSGRAATYPKRSDKLKFFNELKDLRDRLRREREEREREEKEREEKERGGVTTGTEKSSIQPSNSLNSSHSSLSSSEKPSIPTSSASEGSSADSERCVGDSVGQLSHEDPPQRVAVIVSAGNRSQSLSDGLSKKPHLTNEGAQQSIGTGDGDAPTINSVKGESSIVRSPYFQQNS